jgi:hypothetical protein
MRSQIAIPTVLTTYTKKEFSMKYPEACEASPLNAAINHTGQSVVMGVRLGVRADSPIAWCVQRRNTSAWRRVDIINFPIKLGVDPNAWEPLTAWSAASSREDQVSLAS